MKKLMAMLLAGIMAASLTACGGSDGGSNTANGGTGASDYKIAIVTGTVSQGEEEFRAAENLKAQYPDKIVTATYPDNFQKETETTISNILNLVADPQVKGLVLCQAVPGGAAAVAQAREINPDLVVTFGVMQEDPNVTNGAAEVTFNVDEISMGKTIPDQAKAMGAKTLVQYSFPRHMSIQSIALRSELMEQRCKELGITYVAATAPDPLGDSGVSGSQQFIKEDVPKKIAEYGEDTAFFATNCGMQEALIQAVVNGKAIMPQQCCPSPYHGIPAALGISIPEDKAGDVSYILQAEEEKLVEAGMAGRISTWKVPVNMMFVEAGVRYIDGRIDGSITPENKMQKIEEICEDIAGTDVQIIQYNDGTKTYENIYTVLCGYYTFGGSNEEAAPAEDGASSEAVSAAEESAAQ